MKYICVLTILSVLLCSTVQSAEDSSMIISVKEAQIKGVGLVKVGENVVHPIFGVGKVVHIMPTESVTLIKVEFPEGTKPLVAEMADLKLEK